MEKTTTVILEASVSRRLFPQDRQSKQEPAGEKTERPDGGDCPKQAHSWYTQNIEASQKKYYTATQQCPRPHGESTVNYPVRNNTHHYQANAMDDWVIEAGFIDCQHRGG